LATRAKKARCAAQEKLIVSSNKDAQSDVPEQFTFSEKSIQRQFTPYYKRYFAL